MAFTKTPMESTEQNKRVPLLTTWETRNASNAKDVDNVNVIWDIVQDPEGTYFEAVKRDGLQLAPFQPLLGVVYGAYSWESRNEYVAVTSVGLEVRNITGGGVVFTQSLDFGSPNNRAGFTEYQYEDGATILVIVCNLKVYVYNGASVTQITDPDLPVNPLPFPVYLDGYLFIAGSNGNISNSNLNDPFSWQASNFISVESYADGLQAIARQGQYIVAFGAQSIQFFYDAGNPTGTPLAVQSKVLRIGYTGGLAQTADSLLFIGRPVNGQPGVYMLQGTEAKEMASNSATRRLSEYASANLPVDRIGSILAINGHTLYVWMDIDRDFTNLNQTTYALDLATNMWTRLTKGYSGSMLIKTAVSRVHHDRFSTLITLYNSNKVYEFLPTYSADEGDGIEVRFRTNKLDFGTKRMKFGSKLTIVSDRETVPGYSCFISWSDDDYQTWSTPRSVDLADQYPVLWALGSFRARSFLVTHRSPYPMRWRAFELDYNQGAA